MKDAFLIYITLPEVFTRKFYGKIPRQRSVMKNLMDQQIVVSYAMDMERKNMWVFMSADSEHAVMDVLSTFPIIKDIKVTIRELAFYDTAPKVLPDLIMN